MFFDCFYLGHAFPRTNGNELSYQGILKRLSIRSMKTYSSGLHSSSRNANKDSLKSHSISLEWGNLGFEDSTYIDLFIFFKACDNGGSLLILLFGLSPSIILKIISCITYCDTNDRRCVSTWNMSLQRIMCYVQWRVLLPTNRSPELPT